jgi:hypothetical protein
MGKLHAWFQGPAVHVLWKVLCRLGGVLLERLLHIDDRYLAYAVRRQNVW